MTTPIIEKLKEERSALYENFYSGTTAHGIAQLCEEKGLRRFLWYIVFIACFILGVILFIGVTEDYYRYKTFVTTRSFNYEQKDIALPTITICNKVALIFKGYERVKRIINITQKEYESFYIRYLSRYKLGSEGFTPVELRIIEALHKNNITKYFDALNLFEINEEDLFHDPVAKIFLATAPDATDFPTCRVNYKHQCLTKKTVSWRESLCFQINPYISGKEPLKGYISSNEKYQNVIAVLNTGRTSRFLNSFDVRKSAPYMDLIEGVVLYLHPYGTPHHIPKYLKRIFLRPGAWHFLKLDYKEILDLPPPYATQCGARPLEVIKGDNYPYSQATCLIDCFLQLKMDQCGCVGWEFEDLVDLPMCNLTQLKCFTKSRGTRLRECAHKKICPSECRQEKYKVSVTQHNIRDDSVVERALKLPGWKLNYSETENYILKNLIGLQIEYSSNAHVEELLPAVTWNNLIATIGGSIGLALGFSLITLFEFIFFLYDYTRYSIKIWRQSKLSIGTLINVQQLAKEQGKESEQVSTG